MAVKNPFIRYKIYSTSTGLSEEEIRLIENVKVVCLITKDDIPRTPFLKKILAAAKLPEKDNQIISLAHGESFSAADQGWFDKADYILLFGISANDIGIQTPQKIYHRMTIRETTILQLPGLEKMEPDKNEKQKLWQLMKKVFLHD